MNPSDNSSTNIKRTLEITDWGLVPYQEAFERQKQTVDGILSGELPEQIVFCTHPPVVTLGRGTLSTDVYGWRGETVTVNRGGRATYHGPSQLIMYPLIYLGKNSGQFVEKKIPVNDLHGYMRALELSVIDVLNALGIKAQSQPLQQQLGETQEKEATGVWIDDKKIAAIGIAVKGWVSSHGVALNIHKDPNAFQGINPCGFRPHQVTSIEDQLQIKVGRKDVLALWQEAILRQLMESPDS